MRTATVRLTHPCPMRSAAFDGSATSPRPNSRPERAGGITQQYVSHLERGLRPSRVVHIDRLAHALGVDVHELRGLPPRPADPDGRTP